MVRFTFAALAHIKTPVFHLLLTVMTIWGASVQASTMKLVSNDGSTRQFDGVVVESVFRDAQNNLVFSVAPKPGEPSFEVPISDIVSIDFGFEGHGRYFDVTSTLSTGQVAINNGVRVTQFNNGQFSLYRTETSDMETISADNIIEFISNDNAAPIPTPVPERTPAPRVDEFVFESDINSDNDFTFAEEDYSFSEEQYGSASGTDMAFGIAALVFLLIYALLVLTNSIMMTVDAVQNDQLIWILGIWCCFPFRYYYAFAKYEGFAPLFVKIITGLEILMFILSRVA